MCPSCTDPRAHLNPPEARLSTTRLLHPVTVLAGPSGVGKGAVSADVRRRHPHVWISVSATTRRPRPGEVDGVHYHFVGDDEFDRMIADGDLLEWAVIHSQQRSGTPRRGVEDVVAQGRPVLLEIDIQGARQVRHSYPDAAFVFLAPPSWEELLRRLDGRGTEEGDELQRRLATARTELAAESEFDLTIVNHHVEQAADELVHFLDQRAPVGA